MPTVLHATVLPAWFDDVVYIETRQRSKKSKAPQSTGAAMPRHDREPMRWPGGDADAGRRDGRFSIPSTRSVG